MPLLSPCKRCLRHVRARDLVCPFCFAAAALLGACKTSAPDAAADASTPVASASAHPSSAPSASGPFAGLGGDRGGAVYGGPTPAGPQPTMRETSVVVDGPLPREVVQRIVRQSFGRLRACYVEGLRDDPKLKGTVGVSFTVEKSGAAAAATIVPASTTLRTKAVQDCLVHEIGQLSFPAPGDPVRVVYALAFFPTAEP